MLPFEQFGQITVNREGLLAIEIGRQTGPDLASEAAEARKALSSVLSVIGVPLLATKHVPVLGRMDRPEFPFMAVNDASEILNDCCCAVTAN